MCLYCIQTIRRLHLQKSCAFFCCARHYFHSYIHVYMKSQAYHHLCTITQVPQYQNYNIVIPTARHEPNGKPGLVLQDKGWPVLGVERYVIMMYILLISYSSYRAIYLNYMHYTVDLRLQCVRTFSDTNCMQNHGMFHYINSCYV